MARPALNYEPVTINVKLTLHPEMDADLITWFDQVPRRSRAGAVITALRTGGLVADVRATTAVDEAELFDVLDAMLFKLTQ